MRRSRSVVFAAVRNAREQSDLAATQGDAPDLLAPLEP